MIEAWHLPVNDAGVIDIEAAAEEGRQPQHVATAVAHGEIVSFVALRLHAVAFVSRPRKPATTGYGSPAAHLNLPIGARPSRRDS